MRLVSKLCSLPRLILDSVHDTGGFVRITVVLLQLLVSLLLLIGSLLVECSCMPIGLPFVSFA
jgi:hypothetical protein